MLHCQNQEAEMAHQEELAVLGLFQPLYLLQTLL
jgi:hypothetical protein